MLPMLGRPAATPMARNPRTIGTPIRSNARPNSALMPNKTATVVRSAAVATGSEEATIIGTRLRQLTRVRSRSNVLFNEKPRSLLFRPGHGSARRAAHRQASRGCLHRLVVVQPVAPCLRFLDPLVH